MSDDEWPPDSLGQPTFRTGNRQYTDGAEYGVDAVDIGVAMTLYLLQEGDKVLWPDRKRRLTVDSQSERRAQAYDTGMWDPTAGWRVEGSHGGKYLMANWWPWEKDADDEYIVGAPKYPFPNVARTSGEEFAIDAKPTHLAVWGDGMVATRPPLPEEFDDVVSVVYEKPMRDQPYVGHVTGDEFGSLNVQRVCPFGVDGDHKDFIDPVDPIEEAVDPEAVVAFRRRSP